MSKENNSQPPAKQKRPLQASATRWNQIPGVKFYNSFNIGWKLNLSFGILVAMTLLVVLLGAIGRQQVSKNINITNEVTAPSTLTSAQAQISLLEMVANLRGYLLLGNTQSISDFRQAQQDFEANLAELEQLLSESDDSANKNRLAQVEELYKTWQTLPETLFELHDNPRKNQPGLQIYHSQVRPLSAVISDEMSRMVELQRAQETNPEQSRLLNSMIDFQATFDSMMTNLQAYATIGDLNFKVGYTTRLPINTAAWETMRQDSDLLTPEQQEKMATIATAREEIFDLPFDIFAAVESEQAYEDLYLFRNEAKPQAEAMILLLDDLSEAQQTLLQSDLNKSRTSLTQTQIQTTLGAFLTLLLSIVMVLIFQDTIAGSVQRLTRTAETIADGDLNAQANIEARDEIGRLAEVFNMMTGRLRHTISSLKRQTQQLETIVVINHRLTRNLHINELGSDIVTRIQNEFDFYHTHIYLLDEQAEYLVLVEGAGRSGQTTLEKGFKIPNRPQNGVVSRAARTGEILVIDDITQEQDWLANPLLPDTRSEMAVPIIVEDRVLGVLDVQQDRVNGFDDSDSKMMKSLADQVAVALTNAHLFEQLQLRASELSKARDTAESASRAKSEFLANMSHELRTPLNGVLGYAQTLQRDRDLTPHQADGLKIIYQSGEHLLTLINDILDLSRIEAGKMDLVSTEINLPAVLDSIVNIVGVRAERKGIQLRYDFAESLPTWVLVDKTRLRQILINLLSNAIKFTDEGVVSLRVQPIRTESENNTETDVVRFQVIDTGIGINEADLERVFQPFEQLGDMAQRREGTGLGLAISRRLAQAMDSELYVSSEAGKGSTFWFDLDLPVVSTHVDVRRSSTDSIVGYAGERNTILVVDDNIQNCSIFVEILEPLGFNVVEAVNGKTAVSLANSIQPDLIIMGITLSDMSGLEATKQIRETGGERPFTIIASSTNVFETEKHKSLEAGCDDFLAKPVVISELYRLLEKHLKLEWVYIDEPVTTNENEPSSTQELVSPPSEELAILYDLTMKGNILEIRKRATIIAELGSAYKPFATNLDQLARSYDEEGILNLINHYLS